MTDDQKSEMATQADFMEEDGPDFHGHSDEEPDCVQSDDELISQSEEEAHSPTESPPLSPSSPSMTEGNMTFDSNSDTSCEMTFSPLEVGEESCELCPSCLQNAQQRRLSPPSLSPDGDMNQIFVEARLKIFQATKELRSRRSRQTATFQRSTPNGSSTNGSPVVKSKINVRESVRKILARRKQSRERHSRERKPNLSVSEPTPV